MEYSSHGPYKPRIIIHGGAGNITKPSLSPERQAAYKASLLRILSHGNALLENGASALHAATSTVSQFEDDPLFNCGKGAVFNRVGGIELEASVMVSSGYKKKGAAASLLRHVKNPILLVKKILEHGEQDMDPIATSGNDSAQGHVHVSGHTAESLAKAYGLELRPQKYFWTRKRWEEHKRGLEGKASSFQTGSLGQSLHDVQTCELDDPPWDGHEYLPQGTVGCVVMDSHGVVCTATSTGGLTNKLEGRIGDTPTFGAGFWAEGSSHSADIHQTPSFPSIHALQVAVAPLIDLVQSALIECIPKWSLSSTNNRTGYSLIHEKSETSQKHVLGLSGTGNGDSFLRVAACRTAAALALPPQIPAYLLPSLSISTPSPGVDLGTAVTAVVGPGGILQQSAEDRWGRTGEGEGGIIGIERRGNRSHVVFDFNSGGMFRGYIDDKGQMLLGIFRGDDEVVQKSRRL